MKQFFSVSRGDTVSSGIYEEEEFLPTLPLFPSSPRPPPPPPPPHPSPIAATPSSARITASATYWWVGQGGWFWGYHAIFVLRVRGRKLRKYTPFQFCM